MNAVDTNVLVRLLVNDDKAQAGRAAALFRSGPVFVAKSVLLETEWVLRYSYEFETAAIVQALGAVLGLPNVTAEDPVAVVAALRLAEQGIEFADALHVASSAAAARFVTFDRRLATRAGRVASPKVVLG